MVCFGRRTITGLLAAGGQQFLDWSADYRLFERERIEVSKLFQVVRDAIVKELPYQAPLVVAMDDTLLKKSGKKTYGVAWRRDPLGPPFRVNFIRGQRFIQLSAALFEKAKASPAKMTPIEFKHAPTPQKPLKKAPPAEWEAYKKEQKEMNLSLVGGQCLQNLRKSMDQDPKAKDRALVAAVDGSYTNRSILKMLPSNTVLIGRIRKDAKLYYPPDDSPKPGRKRQYGRLAPTPEELRTNPEVSYQKVAAWAAGKIHLFKIKTIEHVKWRKAGGGKSFKLVIIAPLAYRLTKQSRLLYRQPAYLICSDPHLPTENLLQFYLWRWGIEVNFRDEKTVLGAGQAQVRSQAAVQNVPAFIVAVYAMLLVAAKKAFCNENYMADHLPNPKWQPDHSSKEISTPKLISHIRAELWGRSLGLRNFSHFAEQQTLTRNHNIGRPRLDSAVLYAIN